MTKFKKLSADQQDDMEATFKELSAIDKEKKDIATEVASYNKKGSTTEDEKTTNTFNIERKLEQLEKDYEDGKYSAGEYQEKKKGYLNTMYDRTTADFKDAYNNSEYKDYYTYDFEKGTFKLDEKKYNEADTDIQEKIDAEGEHLGGIFDTAMDIKDQIGELEGAGFGNNTYNEEATLKAIDRQYARGEISSTEHSQ
jgi:hypothetical protein